MVECAKAKFRHGYKFQLYIEKKQTLKLKKFRFLRKIFRFFRSVSGVFPALFPNHSAPKTQASKFCGNVAGIPRKNFVSMGVQGCLLFVISAMILVALQKQ